jgi:hypothetical protein
MTSNAHAFIFEVKGLIIVQSNLEIGDVEEYSHPYIEFTPQYLQM